MTYIESIQNFLLDILNRIVAFVPTLFGAIAIIAIGWLISGLTRKLITKLGARVKFNEIVKKTGFADGYEESNSKNSPTQMVATLAFWFLFLNFLLAGTKMLGLSDVIQPLELFMGFVPRIIGALITLIIGGLITQFVGTAIQGTVAGMGIDFHQTIGNMVRTLLMVIVVIIVIEQLGLDVTLLTQLFASTITIIIAGLALAFGLGGRGVARNALAGFYAKDLFEPGDIITIDGEEGMLQGIGTLNSMLQVGDSIMTVPNQQLIETRIKKRIN